MVEAMLLKVVLMELTESCTWFTLSSRYSDSIYGSACPTIPPTSFRP